MTEHDLKTRTKAFALRINKMIGSLPKSMPADELTAIFVSSLKTARDPKNPNSAIQNPKS